MECRIENYIAINFIIDTCTLDRTISQTHMHRLLILEGRLRSQGMESVICDVRSGTGQISLQVLRFSPLRIILQVLVPFMTYKGLITLQRLYR